MQEGKQVLVQGLNKTHNKRYFKQFNWLTSKLFSFEKSGGGMPTGYPLRGPWNRFTLAIISCLNGRRGTDTLYQNIKSVEVLRYAINTQIIINTPKRLRSIRF